MTLDIAWPSREKKDRARETVEYFNPKAKDYDKTDEQSYWVFSDRLLWRLLNDHILSDLAKIKPSFSLLDAGCGTARWSSKILEAYPQSSATLLDITPNMLEVSKQKLESMGLSSRAVLKQLDLNDLEGFPLNPHDLAICFHNVLSFVVDPAAVIRSLVNKINGGGTICLVIPNLFHAVSFSASLGRMIEVKRAMKSCAVKFTDEVPEMWVFSPDKIKKIFASAGVLDCSVFGFPVTVYPQFEETQIVGNSSNNSKLFANDAAVQTLFETELVLSNQQEAAARGNNLLVIARKAT
ncbi:MAG: methyltransferase domain-containing protein [Alphaproteobacteria bacterium]|nr:methyltransferase domain-containing protein [Alphaproteobacteria bacterium]